MVRMTDDPSRRRFLGSAARLAAAGVVARGAFGAISSLVEEPGRSPLTRLGSLRRASADAPAIVTRRQWGADESLRRGRADFHPVRKFVVHHTATANHEGDPAGRMRSIYHSHLARRSDDGEPWEDIGYNFVIDEQGRVYEGRRARDYAAGETHDGEDHYERGVRGAHAGDTNGGTVGIAIVGTYHGRRPTSASLDSLVEVIAWKASRHALDPLAREPYTRDDGTTVAIPTIVGHRDVAATACPGDAAAALLPEIRERVARRVRAAESTGPGGYWIVHEDGSITRHGQAGDVTDLRERGIDVPATGLGAVPGTDDFWVVDVHGGVHGFGVPFEGSVPGLRDDGLGIGRAEVVHLAATPSGDGYWLLDRHGGIFGFGDASYHGSVPALRHSGVDVGEVDAVALSPTPSGDGYRVLDRHGGVFNFGDARFHGSVPALREAGVDVGEVDAADLVTSAGGDGYWLLDREGGVFSFGDARFHGSVPSTGFLSGSPARRLVPSRTGRGYLILHENGGVMPFGDAPFHRHGPHLTSVGLVITA